MTRATGTRRACNRGPWQHTSHVLSVHTATEARCWPALALAVHAGLAWSPVPTGRPRTRPASVLTVVSPATGRPAALGPGTRSRLRTGMCGFAQCSLRPLCVAETSVSQAGVLQSPWASRSRTRGSFRACGCSGPGDRTASVGEVPSPCRIRLGKQVFWDFQQRFGGLEGAA